MKVRPTIRDGVCLYCFSVMTREEANDQPAWWSQVCRDCEDNWVFNYPISLDALKKGE